MLLQEELQQTLSHIEKEIDTLKTLRTSTTTNHDQIARMEYYLWCRASSAYASYKGWTKFLKREEPIEKTMACKIIEIVADTLNAPTQYPYYTILKKKLENLH